MGTSNSFGGPGGGKPLVPDWLEPLQPAPEGPEPQPQPDPPVPPEDQPSPTPPAEDPVLPEPPLDSSRFRSPRSQLSSFARSNGSNGAALGRGVAGYVSRAAGGAARAAQRLGAARGTSGRLVDFLAAVVQQGPQQALKRFNLAGLSGKSLQDIFLVLMEQFCPAGGPIDEGIARNAFIDMLDDLTEVGITQLADLDEANALVVFELYAVNCIEARLCNDVAAQSIMLPADPQQALLLQQQLKEFIQGSVSDALAQSQSSLATLTQDQVRGFVDGVYRDAFRILQRLGEQEGQK